MNSQIPLPVLVNLPALALLSPAEAVLVKNRVLTALTGNPFFKDIPLDLLTAAGKSLEGSIDRTAAGDRSSIPDRNASLASVIKELHRVAFQVQVQAIDDENQLHTSGFPIAEHRTRPRRVRAPVTILKELEAINLEEPGEVMLNADSLTDAIGYNFQFTKLGEENWVDDAPAPHKGCKRIVIRGLDPLNKYSFRGRGIGDADPGPWSKPVTISVT
jgi:hypothetical protein